MYGAISVAYTFEFFTQIAPRRMVYTNLCVLYI